MSEDHHKIDEALPHQSVDWEKIERAKRLMALVAKENSDAVHEYCQDLNEEERSIIGCCCGRVTI